MRATGSSFQRPTDVFRVNPTVFWVTLLLALVLQKVLPLKISLARFFDFPLLAMIYFALVRRDEIFGIFLGAGLGLLQDAFSHGNIGFFGMSKALIGYLAASAGIKLDLERIMGRLVTAGILVFIHDLFLQVIKHALLESVPPFKPLNLLISLMVNVALGLILFQILDRFKQPA
ncbi:MAG: rod shape-determining protein MreD [Acidobacteria bacterium]|nr:MAG: rod shape-determining protein MreD [Acidobacteriota bacterium]